MKIWNFITSLRLALILILIVVLLSVCSIFIVQVPHDIAAGSTDFYRWIDEFVRPNFGFWTDTLAFLGLFSVFHSPFFLLVVILLMLNILFCTVKRLPLVFATLRGAGIVSEPAAFPDQPLLRLNGTTAAALAMATTNTLLKKGWRVRETTLINGILVAADKHAFSRLGTLLSHLSLIFLVLGFFLSSLLGFSEDSFLVAEGTVREVGHGTGLSLGLITFGIEQWPDGTVKEYRSQVILYKENQPVDTAIIRVNYPLFYHGTKFYQSYYGSAPVIEVTDDASGAIAGGPVALVGTMADQENMRPVGRLVLPGTGLTAYIIGPALNTTDPVIGPGQVGVELYRDNTTAPSSWLLIDAGTSQENSGLVFSFPGTSYFSVFKVKNEPGIWIVWAAFILFTLGIVMAFFFPYRRIFIRLDQEEENVVVRYKSSGYSAFKGKDELTAFAEDILAKVPGKIVPDKE